MTRASALALCGLVLLLALSACASGPSHVDFRVVVVGDDPFLGADAIALRVERADGTAVLEEQLTPDARAFVLGPLPFDTELTVHLETRVGALPLASGRSFPFALGGPTESPTRVPDLTLGLLGRHAPVLDLPAGTSVLAIAPTSEGALLASSDALFVLVAHGEDGRPHLSDAIDLGDRRGASFIAFEEGLLAVGGAVGGATLYARDGTIAAETASLRARSGAALARSEGAVIVLGGRDERGALLDDVVRIDGASLAITTLPPLPAPRTEMRAMGLSAMSSAGAVPRVLAIDGADDLGPLDTCVVIDPQGLASAVTWTPPAPLRGAAMAAVATGQVLLVGGRDATDTVVPDVRVLFVHAERPLDFLSPAPDTLFRARENAVALSFSSGATLIVGGLDPAGAPIEATELADLRVLPGSVRLTGSLPAPASTTAAALLVDRSILVASGSALTLYFPYPL